MAQHISLADPPVGVPQFLVAAERLPDDPHTAVVAGLARVAERGLAGAALRLLHSGELRCEPEPPHLLGRPRGPVRTEQLRARFDRADHHLAVRIVGAGGAGPGAVQAARAAARALAASCGGLVADAFTGQVLPAGGGAEALEFQLADQWLALYLDRPAARDRGPGRRAAPAEIASAGLARFGLPDLNLRGIALHQWFLATTLLRGLATRLLTDHWTWSAERPGRARRWLAVRTVVDTRDVKRYWGVLDDQPPVASVEVRLTPLTPPAAGAGTRVLVRPRASYTGGIDSWLDRIAALAFPLDRAAARATTPG
ncbi:hypothetical protein [Allonocardiopsis opalescens]|uniref:Uncharacterized protein n=1 Tax=Allonocardiopsis opalescens TaxID=1144618 RepID=A0A2T0QDG5_9ACTN|nr:hypothetical protein [Allonocardiopsis opalescens]PRY01955.1 hypothetical protein CLV72_101553 [Allonocardiopsis opalescens]